MQRRNSPRVIRREEGVTAANPHQVWERLCSRMGNLGTYRLMQINGQRKFFDPLDDSPPMGDGCEVFIGRIPRDMFEDELVPLFAHYGPIHELRLMMNFSGTNRGFAFVMYKHPKYAEEAIKHLNDFEVRKGQFIGVIHSVNNRRLYIGRLPPSSASKATLLKLLESLTEGLQSVTLHSMKKVNVKPNRKFAIAVYVSHRHAAMARRFLIFRKNEIFPQEVSVDWACPTVGLKSMDRSEHLTCNAEKKGRSNASVVRSNPPTILSPKPIPEFVENRGGKPRFGQPLGRHHKNEKLVDVMNVNKGFSYSRLTAPLYSLSPVPKPNSMIFLHSPPSLKNQREVQGYAKENSLPLTKNSAERSDQHQRAKDDKPNFKTKGNRKCPPQNIPRFEAMHNCGMSSPA